MKSNIIYKISAIALVLSLAFVAIQAKAEDSVDDSGVSTGNTANGVITPKPPIPGTTTPKPIPVGEKIRMQVENRLEKNKEIRNEQLDQRESMLQDRKEVENEIRERFDGARMMRASSTEMFKRTKEELKEKVKTMKAHVFEVRKEALIKELNIALNNLQNITSRIESRIEKAESSGRDMSTAKDLLIEAKFAISKAKVNVDALDSLQDPTSDTASTTPETSIDLTKPRALGDAAIKSVKEARDALKKVVEAIAKAMGLGNSASTTEESAQ